MSARTPARCSSSGLNRAARTAALASLLCVMAAPPTYASSHSEAPGTARDRFIDDTDLYAFVAPDAPDAVTFVGNWAPLLEPNGGPNFYCFEEDAAYYINIDNVGDAQDHIRFEFRFTTTRRSGATFLYNTGVVTSLNDPDLNVFQTARITRYDDGVPTVLAEAVPVAPNYVGPKSMPDYEALANEAIMHLPDGSKVFIGPRDDPFFADLAAIFDLLTIRKLPGDKGKGVDGLGGFNSLTIALQVPMTRLTRDGSNPRVSAGERGIRVLRPANGNSIIGIYNSVERPMTRTLNGDGTVSTSGPMVQVSRLGMPLVNEVVIPLQDKDRFNATKPTGDGVFLPYVTDPELAKLLNLLYGISVPPPPRSDLVAVFLTGVPGLNQPAGVTGSEMLRLNMAIPPSASPNRLGVIAGDLAGFPNGRRLADDVIDIAERVVAGVLVPGFNIEPNNRLGDGIDVNDRPFLPVFPYVAPPHNPLDHSHHEEQHGNSEQSRGDDNRRSGTGTNGIGAEIESSSNFELSAAAGRGATLDLTVANPARVSLRVFDVSGRVIRTLVDQEAAAGGFRATWDGRDDGGARASAGLYFARFVVNGEPVATKKIVLE